MQDDAPCRTGKRRRAPLSKRAKRLLPEQMYVMPLVDITLRNPHKPRRKKGCPSEKEVSTVSVDTVVVPKRNGGFDVVRTVNTRRQKLWYIAPEYDNFGLPAQRWYVLEKKARILLGRS